MPREQDARALEVVVVGGGVAALEAVLALHDLAGSRLDVTLIAPEPEFVLRAPTVAAPFRRGDVERLTLREVMDEHGGRFVRGAVERVDAAAGVLRLLGGAEVGYDLLVLAHGAEDVNALPGALVFDAHDPAYFGVLADLEQGYSRSVAFVVPDENTWPLPLYELALKTAEELWSMNMDDVDLRLLTPETGPLEILGAEASAKAAELLHAASITTHLGVHARPSDSTRVEIGSDESIDVDRIVTLPVLTGRRLDGIPANAQGFVPVDDVGLVDGLAHVYAIGDVSDRRVKQAGLACQQADTAAAHIAARAGADVDVPPPEQMLRGRLLTGGRDRVLRREPGHAVGREAEPLWWPPDEVSGTHLFAYFVAKGAIRPPSNRAPVAAGIDVDEHVPHQRLVPGGIVESQPSSPTSS